MSTVIDTLITDRTREDVDELLALLAAEINPAGDHKGSYNASDLNRVGEAVEYLAQRLPLVGIRCKAASLRTDWMGGDNPDIPTEDQMAEYLSAVAGIREAIRDYRPDAALPDSMRFLDFNEANQIESLLRAAEDVVTKVMLSYRGYSGRLVSGVNCLP